MQITTGPGYDSEPQWSPDGKPIAFTRDTRGAMEIWTVSADGGSSVQLTSGSGISVDPEWHSANEIFYTSARWSLPGHAVPPQLARELRPPAF